MISFVGLCRLREDKLRVFCFTGSVPWTAVTQAVARRFPRIGFTLVPIVRALRTDRAFTHDDDNDALTYVDAGIS